MINLPIMVEDPQHPANMRAHKYSTVLLEMVRRKYPAVSTVDFQSACRQHMAQHSPKWQEGVQKLQEQGAPSTNSKPEAAALAATAAEGAGAGAAAAAATEGSGAGAVGRRLWAMTKYSLAGNMAWSKYLQSMLLHQSWDAISAKQGLVLLTDQIHLNDTAAKILADLVQPLMKDVK